MNDQRIIYQDYAEPPVQEIPSVSSWLPEPNQPVKLRQISLAAIVASGLVAPIEPIPNPVVPVDMDSWHVALSEPVREEPLVIAGEYVYALPPPVAEVQDLSWLNPTENPLPREGALVVGDFALIEIDADSYAWLQPLSEPVRAKQQTVIPEIGFVETPAPTPPVEVNLDWVQDFSQPPERDAALVVGESVLIEIDVEGLDWFQSWGEPVVLAPRVQIPENPFVEDFVVPPEVITPDQWFREFSQPIQDRVAAQQTDPAFVELPTIDISWFQPLTVPLIDTRRVVEVDDPQSLTEIPVPDVSTWYRPFNEPPKAKPRAASFYLGLYQGDPGGFVEPTPPEPEPPFEKVWTDGDPTTGSWTDEAAGAGTWVADTAPAGGWTEEGPIEC